MRRRLDELESRRRRLLLRSAQLRSDLAADRRVLLEALSGVDRMYSMARRAVRPLLLAGAGALLLRFIRRSRPARTAGFGMKALFWVSMVRRILPYATLIRTLWRSRSSQRTARNQAAQSAQ